MISFEVLQSEVSEENDRPSFGREQTERGYNEGKQHFEASEFSYFVNMFK